MVSVQLTGVNELMKKFGNLSDRLQGQVVKKALVKAAQPIKQEAKAQAPVADKDIIRATKKDNIVYKPGNLKKSIGIFRGKNKKWLNVQVGAAYGDNKKFNGYYASFVHEGHKLKGGGKTKANPFLKRAKDAKDEESVRIFQSEFDKLVKQTMQ